MRSAGPPTSGRRRCPPSSGQHRRTGTWGRRGSRTGAVSRRRRCTILLSATREAYMSGVPVARTPCGGRRSSSAATVAPRRASRARGRPAGAARTRARGRAGAAASADRSSSRRPSYQIRSRSSVRGPKRMLRSRPLVGLDRQQRIQQGQRLERRIQFHHGVQERRLLPQPDRVGLVDRGRRHDGAQPAQPAAAARSVCSESPRLLPKPMYARFPRKGGLADISIMFSSQMTMQLVRCRIPALAAAGLPNSSRKVPCRPSWN